MSGPSMPTFNTHVPHRPQMRVYTIYNGFRSCWLDRVCWYSRSWAAMDMGIKRWHNGIWHILFYKHNARSHWSPSPCQTILLNSIIGGLTQSWAVRKELKIKIWIFNLVFLLIYHAKNILFLAIKHYIFVINVARDLLLIYR